MRRQCLPVVLIALCIAFVSAAQTVAEAGDVQPAPLHAYLRQGVEKAFNLETKSATDLFQKAVELDQGNPLGYAFLALTRLFSYEMNFDPQARTKDQESLLKDVEEALGRGHKRIEKNPRDAQAYFAMALAKIVKIRWALSQKRYVVIAQESTHVWSYLEKAKTEDPQNYDVYFPLGLLHYHLDHLPAAARVFSSLLITAADHQKGLQELEIAAQKGDLLRELAQTELSSVYTYFEEQPARSLPITRELREKFPRNYNFAFTLATALSELDRAAEALAVAGEIEKGIQTGTPPFVPQLQPRFDHLLGRLLFNQGEYAGAEERFRKALTDTSIANIRIRTSALVRLGMIHDIRRERKQAEEFYTRALAVEGGEGPAQIEARRYLRTPYVPRSKSPAAAIPP
jgi:tetratricopeptide (TPR) repeat protein